MSAEVSADGKIAESARGVVIPWTLPSYQLWRVAVAFVMAALIVLVGFGILGSGPFGSFSRVTSWVVEQLDGGRSATPAPAAETAPPTVAETEPPLFDPKNGVYGEMPFIAKPEFAEGTSGDTVLYLQGVLVNEGGQSALEVNGKFGPETKFALSVVQRFIGLEPTGVADATTWNAIDSMAQDASP